MNGCKPRTICMSHFLKSRRAWPVQECLRIKCKETPSSQFVKRFLRTEKFAFLPFSWALPHFDGSQKYLLIHISSSEFFIFFRSWGHFAPCRSPHKNVTLSNLCSCRIKSQLYLSIINRPIWKGGDQI